MGRDGTGLSSCASAWNGVAVISKKDRHHVTAGSFPSMALYGSRFHKINRNHGRAWALVGRAAIVGESSGPTKDHGISVQQARRIAANIAKLPELLRKVWVTVFDPNQTRRARRVLLFKC